MEDTSASANWLQELLSCMGYQTSVDIRIAEASPEQVNANSKNYWLEINADSLQPDQIQRLIVINFFRNITRIVYLKSSSFFLS